jgi:hypothetical protein
MGRTVADKLRLLELARELGNVSRACGELGFSRDSYYRLKRCYDAAGADGLDARARRAPLLKNRVAHATETAVLEVSRLEPDRGQVYVAARLRARGIAISPAGVRCVWLRHGLETAARRRAWCGAAPASGLESRGS